MVLDVNDRETPAEGKEGVDDTLEAFLAFRESDMQQWRRAGAVTGLTHSAMLALSTLLRAELRGEPLRQVDLQKRLHLSPAGISTIVDELEARRLVERRRSDADRRAYVLHAAADARPFLDRLARVDNDFRAHVAELTANQRAAVIGLLDFMRDIGDADYQ